MGASYSNNHGSPYDYGMPPRKRRANISESGSNHFDKNYLIESSEFWTEKKYREDCYFRTGAKQPRGSHSRDSSENVFQKTPTEYYWSNTSSYSSTASSSASSSPFASSLPKQKSDESCSYAAAAPPPPPLIPRNSLQNMAGPRSAMNSPHRPPGIQPKYLPSFG